MTIRRALPDMVLAASLVGILRWVPWLQGMSEPLVLTGICASAFVVLATAAIRYRHARLVWVQMAGAALALTAHHGSFLLWARPGSVASTAAQVEIAACAGVAAVLTGSAMVQTMQPLLSYAPTRRVALWSVPMGLIGASSVPLADPLLYPHGRGVFAWLVLGLALATIGGLAVMCAVSFRSLVRAGRTIELRLALVFVAFLGLAVFATLTDYDAYWAMPGVCAMVGVAASSMTGSARRASTPIGARPLIATVRRRWVAAGAVPIVLMTPVIHLGAPPEIAIVCFTLTTAIYGIFVRDVVTVPPAPVPRRSARAAAVAQSLPAALIHERLTMHYQPIVRMHDRAVVGFEALLRWHDDELGDVAVEDILAAAEWSGLSAVLDGHAVEHVSRQLPTVLPLLAADEPYLAVNVSPITLQRPGFAREMIDRLSALGCSVDGLVLEIVEQGVIANWDALRDNVLEFQHAGALIALDDFGTGTSNLHYLSEIDADLVKLDRSLVRWATTSTGRAVVGRIVEMTRAAGLQMIAEGIEDTDTLDALAALGVDMAQGYLFGRPLPLTEAIAALAPAPSRLV